MSRRPRLATHTPARRPAWSEAAFQDDVIELCANLHLRTMHIRPAQIGGRWVTAVGGDGVGFPDLVIVGPGGTLFRELKVPPNSTTPEQRAWLDALVDAGCDAKVWTPQDWQDRRILAELVVLRRKQVA